MIDQHDTTLQHRQSESGSVFFYLFLAISLFAALTFALSEGGRTGSVSLSDERIGLYANEIIEYGNMVGNAVSQTRLRGVEETEISFENYYTGAFFTNNDCSEERCEIFNIDGGGIVYQRPRPSYFPDGVVVDWTFSGRNCVVGVGSGGTGCDSDGEDNEELMMFLPGIREDICMAINELVGVSNPGGTPPEDTDDGYHPLPFSTTWQFAELHIIDDADNALEGKMTGCFVISGTTYVYFQVLLPR